MLAPRMAALGRVIGEAVGDLARGRRVQPMAEGLIAAVAETVHALEQVVGVNAARSEPVRRNAVWRSKRIALCVPTDHMGVRIDDGH